MEKVDDRGCQNGLVLRKNVMEIPTIDHKMTRSLNFFWCWNCFDPNTVLPRLVRRRTIKLMSFLIKKITLILNNFLRFLAFFSREALI